MDQAIATLKKWIDESDNIVFFGGAGVSTESGIKDFRSVDGLYSMKFQYPPETMLSRTFFDTHPEELLQHASPHALHAGHQLRIEPHERNREGEEIDDQRSSRVEHTDSEEAKSPTPLRQGHASERQLMARCYQGVADGRQLKP